MTEKIRVAMQTCATDPAAGGQGLQALLNEDREGFFRASLPLIGSERDTPGYEHLLKALARSEKLAGQLCDPDLMSRDASIELARSLVQFEPQLDTKLVRLLPNRDATMRDPANTATIERALELLGAVSTCARIVPALTHLLHDQDPRLRAKAALLIGRRVQTSRLAEDRLQEKDPRVRANAIEALWGGKASSADVFRLAAKDTNNRVVGNALFGLYQLQDRGAVAHIFAMAADSNPMFRTTAAWTMGQTSDPRFLPALEKLTRDLYASVRKNASKAIERVRECTAAAGCLQVQILRQERGARRLSERLDTGAGTRWQSDARPAGVPVHSVGGPETGDRL